jgi:hypothetical protein
VLFTATLFRGANLIITFGQPVPMLATRDDPAALIN